MMKTHLKKKIEGKIKEMRIVEEKISIEQGNVYEYTKEYNQLQLQLEQAQITIKHDHESRGTKPTPAKEKAKLETEPEQEKLLNVQDKIDGFKQRLNMLKRKQKLNEKELDFLMLQYQECTGDCKCNG